MMIIKTNNVYQKLKNGLINFKKNPNFFGSLIKLVDGGGSITQISQQHLNLNFIGVRTMKCKELIFHFNKGHLADPSIPMWVIKAKGQTHYVEHVDANVGWSTKETPDNPSTKGSIKFKNVELLLEGGTATINPA